MSCKTADFLLYRVLQQPNAAPFLGLLNLSENSAKKAIAEARNFIAGDPEKLPRLFQKYPYFFGWLITHYLNDSYGEEGQKVYPLIEDVLGVNLPAQGPTRKNLYEAFKQVCDKLGLPSGGLYPTQLYLLHAGVAKAQLHHLIEAFLRQHDLFGAPPTASTAQLNRWEDDALEFLPHTVQTLPRAILWDETAWNARLYARIARAPEFFQPSTPFEEAFFKTYQTVKSTTRRSATAAPGAPSTATSLGR